MKELPEPKFMIEPNNADTSNRLYIDGTDASGRAFEILTSNKIEFHVFVQGKDFTKTGETRWGIFDEGLPVLISRWGVFRGLDGIARFVKSMPTWERMETLTFKI
jgi:hypothetical protein